MTDLYWQDTTGSAQSAFYLDDIALLAGSVSPPPAVGPGLTINVGADRHAINDDIYGINLLPDEGLATELRLPVRRWGGNSTSRYNWQNDTFNTGNDWYFENIPQDNLDPALLPDGSTTDRFVEQNRRTATRTLMTVPMIGWVAKRRTSGHPYDCGFRISRYGTQPFTDPWDTDCGNGVAGSGTNLMGNDPTDTSTAIGPSFVSAWISHLVGKYGTAANGGVAYYAFDNEPMIWSSTHRDVHPQAPTYDEIRDRTTQYGAAIKAADPSARTLGPVEDGWCRYLYSMADQCSPGADYQAHGSIPYVAWYLQQMRNYEQHHALRILDYFDLHYYPSADSVSLSSAGGTATQALRLRSTRSLWDSTYIDESWISDTASGGVAVRMIPRMKQWVADNYPGTKVAISEYNWGGFEHINGALAQADVLGLFGREGLDLATFLGEVPATQPGTFAFRMYRDYDGSGHGFGDTAVQSSSTDQGVLAVYAAQRSADGALTILVINKSANNLTSLLALTGFNPQTNASVYRYSSASLAAIEHAADQPVTAGGFTATFPASSITLFVVASAGNAGSYTLSVALSGSGSGRIESADGHIHCGTSQTVCSASYGISANVTLTATPNPGFAFAGWSGACNGTNPSCPLIMDATQSVTANFNSALISQSITFDAVPSVIVGGTGTVSATATSGLAVTFSSTTPGICTVSGSTVIGVAVGTCTIAADQAGNSIYSAVPQVTRNFSIAPSSGIVSPSPPTIISITAAHGSATLNLSSPNSNGGSAIVAYSATCTANDQFTKTASGSGLILTVRGLKGGSHYSCTARASNTSYTSSASAAQTVIPLPGGGNITPVLMMLLD